MNKLAEGTGSLDGCWFSILDIIGDHPWFVRQKDMSLDNVSKSQFYFILLRSSMVLIKSV